MWRLRRLPPLYWSLYRCGRRAVCTSGIRSLECKDARAGFSSTRFFQLHWLAQRCSDSEDSRKRRKRRCKKELRPSDASGRQRTAKQAHCVDARGSRAHVDRESRHAATGPLKGRLCVYARQDTDVDPRGSPNSCYETCSPQALYDKVAHTIHSHGKRRKARGEQIARDTSHILDRVRTDGGTGSCV